MLADAGYGTETAFRERLGERGLAWVVGVTGQLGVCPPGPAPLPPPPSSGRGNVPTRQRLGRAAHQRPLSMKELAPGLPATLWHTVEWHAGSDVRLRSRLARVRVRAAHRDDPRTQTRAGQWALIEWPEGPEEPMKDWLSTLAQDEPLERMVLEAKMRRRTERDHLELKHDLGLGDCEGRGWRGLHHHASLSIAAYGFLMGQQLRPPPSAGKKMPPDAKALPYPRITGLAAARRTQRHVPSSITRLRLRLAAALLRTLPRCAGCLRVNARRRS